MYIKRIAEDFLAKTIKNKKILMILGARQVGKTTLIKHFLEGRKAMFLNFDIEADKNKFLAMASLAPQQAMKAVNEPEYLIIDEAQRLKDTGRIVKGWYDAEVNPKIILLGSSSLDLINQSAESLTGRNEKLFLPPLLFKEIIKNELWYSDVYGKDILNKNFSGQINSLLLNSLVFGNYPEAVSLFDKQQYLLNLADDYLLKDILQLGLIKTPDLIKKLLMLIAGQIGAEVSVNELAVNLGMNKATVNRYLDLLEETFVIFRLPSFSSNSRKEISKSQKIYFYDTGIRNAVLNEFSLSFLRGDIGRLWENWVIAEFAKNNLLSGKKSSLYFWRSRAKSEVDLIVKENERIAAYEIKWKKQNINKRAFENMYKVNIKIIDSSNPLFID